MTDISKVILRNSWLFSYFSAHSNILKVTGKNKTKQTKQAPRLGSFLFLLFCSVLGPPSRACTSCTEQGACYWPRSTWMCGQNPFLKSNEIRTNDVYEQVFQNNDWSSNTFTFISLSWTQILDKNLITQERFLSRFVSSKNHIFYLVSCRCFS